MEKVLLIIAASASLCSVSSFPSREFHFVSELKTWTEAQSYCRQNYTDLVTIHTQEDMDILKAMVDSGKVTWIGFYNSWRWSMSSTDFYKYDEVAFTNWYSGNPIMDRDCGVMHVGHWHSRLCDENLPAVCCNVTDLNVTFFYINDPMNWTEAQGYCRKHHTDLASARNMTENQKISNVIPWGTSAWFGLFKGSWKWSDGRESAFEYWKEGQPIDRMENCAAADFGDSGRWSSSTCNERRPFICSKDLTITKKVIKVRVETSLDLNDPAVLEEMLKQFKGKLKDQGVDGDVKVSWRKQSDGKVFHKDETETKQKITARQDEL